MSLLRYIVRASAALLLATSLGGAALADGASVTTTGPNSDNSAVINNSTDVNTSVSNNVQVTNLSEQSASSGNSNVSGNTNGGSATTGAADNNNQTASTVAINNPEPGIGGMGGSTGGSVGTSSGGSGSGAPGSGGRGGLGSVLGASTVGGLGAGASSVATLPQVGASQPVDVSALRALYNPNAQAPTTSLTKHTEGISTLFLVIAAMLSLAGAIGSAVYAQRQEKQRA